MDQICQALDFELATGCHGNHGALDGSWKNFCDVLPFTPLFQQKVICQHDQVHAGEKGGEEWQHTMRSLFVAAITKGVEAGHGEL